MSQQRLDVWQAHYIDSTYLPIAYSNLAVMGVGKSYVVTKTPAICLSERHAHSLLGIFVRAPVAIESWFMQPFFGGCHICSMTHCADYLYNHHHDIALRPPIGTYPNSTSKEGRMGGRQTLTLSVSLTRIGQQYGMSQDTCVTRTLTNVEHPPDALKMHS